MSFPEYWKEISLVLAGVFAILSVFWEPKDKSTGRLTRWGRFFISLTIIAVLCGVFAQWQESAADAKRAAKSEQQSLELLGKMNGAITELARVMQPLDPSSVTLYLDINCALEVLEKFCVSIRAQGDAYATQNGDTGDSWFEVHDLNWNAWPGPTIVPIRFSFLKSSIDVVDFIRKGCSTCNPRSDAELIMLATPPKDLYVWYGLKSKLFQIVVQAEPPVFSIETKKIMSVPDLQGSTMIVSEPNGFLDKLEPINFLLSTPRKQGIQIKEFKPIEMSGHRIFIYSFPTEREVQESVKGG